MLNRLCCPRGGRKVTWPESIFSTQPIVMKLFLSSADPLPDSYLPLLLEIERRRFVSSLSQLFEQKDTYSSSDTVVALAVV